MPHWFLAFEYFDGVSSCGALGVYVSALGAEAAVPPGQHLNEAV